MRKLHIRDLTLIYVLQECNRLGRQLFEEGGGGEGETTTVENRGEMTRGETIRRFWGERSCYSSCPLPGERTSYSLEYLSKFRG